MASIIDAVAAAVHDRPVVGGFGHTVDLRRGERVHNVDNPGQQVVDQRLPEGRGADQRHRHRTRSVEIDVDHTDS